MRCRKSFIFSEDSAWVKKDHPSFDVVMGEYDGAEICELVGFYLLDNLSLITKRCNTGLYRDDGLMILRSTSGPDTEI